MPVAVKLMVREKKNKLKYYREVEILRVLQKEVSRSGQGFPLLFHYEELSTAYAVIMEKLGNNLKELMQERTSNMSLKNVISIGI